MEQKNSGRARVKVAFFCVLGLHVAGLMVLLVQGCKREQTPGQEPQPPALTDTNLPVVDTNAASLATTVVPQPVPVPETTPTPPVPTPQEYTIQKGDSFYTIAKKFSVTAKAIQDANPNVNPTKLQIGHKIVIPAPTGPAPGAPPGGVSPVPLVNGEQTYVVQSGDTLTRIATKFGTTANAIRKANNLTTDRIKVGDKLKIPVKATAPTAPAPAETAPQPAPAPATTPPGA